jgi:hypothetical protein
VSRKSRYCHDVNVWSVEERVRIEMSSDYYYRGVMIEIGD